MKSTREEPQEEDSFLLESLFLPADGAARADKSNEFRNTELLAREVYKFRTMYYVPDWKDYE